MLTARVVSVTVRKPFDPVEIPTAKRGEVIEPEYRLKRDDNMNCHYVKVGERNVVEYIQSFKNGTALSSILERIKFMPLHEKVAQLTQQQTLSADLSNMPTDGTEAFILFQKEAKKHPEFFKRFQAGESFDSLVKEFFVKTAQPVKTDPKPAVVEDAQKEVTNG